VIASFPRPQAPLIAAGPAEPCSAHDRCWADEPNGQQCAAVIDDDDLLGLCERHRALLRQEGGLGGSSVAAEDSAATNGIAGPASGVGDGPSRLSFGCGGPRRA
jgi:hypothetical protein